MSGLPSISREFFKRDPLTCARELIGCELVWNGCAGIIVETEAYTATGDEASHVFFRPSARVFINAHQAGAAYVYFNYGMYWLFNVLVKGGSEDGFVLIRALEPIRGLEAMRLRRSAKSGKTMPDKNLCAGPGKLTIAMGIDGTDHGRDLCDRRDIGFQQTQLGIRKAVSDTRIGISRSAHLPWRFLAEDSDFVSVKPSSARGFRQRPVNK